MRFPSRISFIDIDYSVAGQPEILVEQG